MIRYVIEDLYCQLLPCPGPMWFLPSLSRLPLSTLCQNWFGPIHANNLLPDPHCPTIDLLLEHKLLVSRKFGWKVIGVYKILLRLLFPLDCCFHNFLSGMLYPLNLFWTKITYYNGCQGSRLPSIYLLVEDTKQAIKDRRFNTYKIMHKAYVFHLIEATSTKGAMLY